MNRVKATVRWMVRKALENPGGALAWLATLTILVTTVPLWGTTMNRAGDDLYHLANEAQVAMALERGQNPFGPLDIMFGTPKPLRAAVNIGVLKEENVNLVVHGHEPVRRRGDVGGVFGAVRRGKVSRRAVSDGYVIDCKPGRLLAEGDSHRKGRAVRGVAFSG